MHYPLTELPVVFSGAGIVTREAALGDFDCSYEVLPRGLDLAPLFRGLPGGLCQCPHWGYLLSGRVRVVYADHAEVIEPGHCFYLPAGHLPRFEEDSAW